METPNEQAVEGTQTETVTETANDAATETVNEAGPSELDMLKQRARMMGINFSNNIGIEALRQKVEAKMAGEAEAPKTDVEQVNALEVTAQIAVENATSAPVGADNIAKVETPQAKAASLRSQMLREQTRLVRCRIQNLDPKKKDLPGEIFTVANEVVGTIRKFVPYGEVTDDGYHLPYIIYRQLERRKFLNIRTGKDRRTGTPVVSSSWAKEFAIEVLPPLTQEELDRLAAAQAAAGGVD